MGDWSDNSSMEGDLSFSGNSDILVDKAEEHVDKNIELHSHMSNSPTKIEFSGNCVDLFLDVFGPLDEIDESYDDLNIKTEHVIPGSRESDKEYACEENGTMSNDSEIASFKNEDECVFNVSDLVWAKARTQTWWPGIICDPSSDAAKDATKSGKRGPFLVKYFGNPYFTWCSNSDLRPFAEYFQPMSRQNDSRNFLGSVDKALVEIGRRVKSKMTCRCFFKECDTLPAHISSEGTEKSPPMDSASKFDDLYLSEFKPVSFCSYIRNLASGFSVPNKVELTVAKNRLSAFYCSIARYQLPMQLLKPSCDTPLTTQDNLTSKTIDEGQNTSGSVTGFEKSGHGDDFIATGRKNHSDGNSTSSGKEPELRKRKKSKYLSYPYGDGDQSGKISSTVGHGILKSPKVTTCAIAKVQKKGKGMEKVKESGKNQGVNSASVIDNASNKEPEKDDQQVKGSSKRVKAKKKEEVLLSAGMEPAGNLLNVSGITAVNKSPTITFQPEGSDIPKNETPKKRKKGEASSMHLQLETQGSDIPKNKTPKKEKKREASPTHLQLETQGSDIPENETHEKRKKGEASPAHLHLETQRSDIPKNITPEKREKGEASPVHLQCETEGSDILKNKTPEEKKKGEASPTHLLSETTARLPDLDGNISRISFENMPLGISVMHQDTQNINGNERSSSSGYKATESTFNLIHNAIELPFQNSLQKVILPCNGKPERKKWKRKKETCQVASVIPDGTTVNTPSVEKIQHVEYHTSPEGDHPQKKRRISRPNEDLGAMVLLNFALEHPLPSKETLVATFSRFGLLKESETQFLDDSSVQIFYERTADAQFAIRRLEKSNPFEESLVSFKFHRLAFASTTEMKETKEKAASTVGKNHKKLHLPLPFSPADTIKVSSPRKGNAPNLTFIKKNMDMMKMTLEKAGDSLSPEMRAKLENEIKGFLNKIASMDSASSP